jgi:hypothetical protein
VKGGKCLVNWNTLCHPKPLGGLGILNLEIMHTAFKVRWAWNLRAEERKPWCTLASPVEEKVRQIFNAASKVIIGNGERCFFWTDKWINGGLIEEIALEVFQSIPLAIRARRTVAQALKMATRSMLSRNQ